MAEPGRTILVLSPFPPSAEGQNGGSRVLLESLLHLAARHRVALLCLRGSGEPVIAPALVARCLHAEAVERPERRDGRGRAAKELLDRLDSGMRGTPVWVAGWRVPAYDARVAALLEELRPDVVQAEYEIMAQYVHPRTDAIRVLVVHEPGVLAATERWREAHGARRGLRWLDRRAWRRWEREALQRADAVVAFTEADRAVLTSSIPTAAIYVIPFGTELPERPLDPLGADPPSVVFVANFGHAPNVRAAMVLLERILPQARRRCPALEAWIVGPRPTEEMLALANHPLDVVTGAVPEVTPYTDRATAIVAPLWTGGGMRVKAVEALAAGKALVATSRALDGLAVEHGVHVMIADDADAFAGAITELLCHPERRATLARRARAWAADNLDWEVWLDRHEAMWAAAGVGGPR